MPWLPEKWRSVHRQVLRGETLGPIQRYNDDVDVPPTAPATASRADEDTPPSSMGEPSPNPA